METSANPIIKSMSPLLLVDDINRSIAFYHVALGFDVDFVYEDFYAGIGKDGFSIHLKSGKSSSEERNSRKLNQNLNILFTVAAIESLYSQMLNKPVDIIQPLRDMPYGKEFYIADPDGNLIGFLE